VREDGDEPRYVVRFEGKHEMTVVVRHGEDLQKPDRPFPTLFEDPYDLQYISSRLNS
jgi:hypothetical protein